MLVSTAPCTAQQATRASQSIEHWGTKEGLPQAQINALAQSQDGRIWIATFGGLARFDGRKFETFDLTNHPTLGSNRIIALLETRAGTLWVGTQDGGLSRYSNGSFFPIHMRPGLPASQVLCLLEDAAGRVWVSTQAGLAWIDGDRAIAAEFDLGRVQLMAQAKDATHWMLGESTLWRKAPGQDQVSSESGGYTSVYAAPDGSLWLGRYNAVEHFVEDRFETLDLPDYGAIRFLQPHPDGFIIAGGDKRQARIFEDAPPSPFLSDGARLEASCSLLDREGNLWLGGSAGLYRLRKSPMMGRPLPEFKSSPITLLMAPDRRLWMACYDGQLGYIEGPDYLNAKLHRILSPSGDRLALGESLALAEDDSIISSASFAMWKIASDGHNRERSEADASHAARNAIFRDRSGALWLGGDEGQLTMLGPGGRSSWNRQDGIPGGRIAAIYESPSGELWVGSSQGICYLQAGRVKRTWSVNSSQGPGSAAGLVPAAALLSLPVGAVRTFNYAGPGQVWVGSYGGGLYRVSTQGDVRTIDKRQGLHEMVVSRIVDDRLGNLVLQGNLGLSVYSRAELDAAAEGSLARLAVRVFDSGPGIGELECNGGSMPLECRDASGALWFPTREGLLRFDPSIETRIDAPPKVLITSAQAQGLNGFEVPGMPAPPAISIEPGDGSLRLEFAVVTFVEPERARVRYQLEGYDREWLEAGALRQADYTRVPPGSYRFRVMAANRDGVWSEKEAALEVNFLPAFHQQGWFRSLLALGLGSLVLLAFRQRTRQIRHRSQELKRQVAERTAELSAARDELEERVKRRTNELAQTLTTLRQDMAKREQLEVMLRQSQKYETVGRLAGGLAHDFNNILTSVLGDAEIIGEALAKGPVNKEDIEESVKGISHATRQAARLTRQLLAYSRNQVLQPVLLDPKLALLALQPMLRRLILEDTNLLFDVEDSLGSIKVDPGQFEQVIVNLVVNAKDAISEGGRIRIGTSRLAPAPNIDIIPTRSSQKFICITVSDTGCGIDPGNIEHIFEPFFSTKEAWQGSGLGLASVQGIVKQSGGHIQVSSQVGLGTTFEVFFPELESASLRLAEAGIKPSDGTAAEGLSVLLCDDEPAVRRVTSRMLESFGYRVKIAAGPAMALELAGNPQTKLDLLVTDMVMPDINGLRLASKLRKLHPTLAVLFVSGYSSIPNDETFDANSAFLNKPYSLKQLKESIATLMARSEAAQAELQA